MRKLGRNHGAYHGETIQIETVLARVLAAARRHNWSVQALPVAGVGQLYTLHRRPVSGGGGEPVPRIYLSTGMHGDEPAGPLALCELLWENRWPSQAELWVCPCLNPTGFPLNRRENAAGADLNRDYRARRTPEVRAHTAWLERQPRFDLAICLHEDWESHGFYLYELNPDGQPSAAERIIAAVAAVCPIDRSAEIEGRPAGGGIIRPVPDLAGRPDWPEAFYLLAHQTRHSYTFEAPSDFPLATRVTALVTAVGTLLTGEGAAVRDAQTVADGRAGR